MPFSKPYRLSFWIGPVETGAGSVRTTWMPDSDGNRVQIGQPG